MIDFKKRISDEDIRRYIWKGGAECVYDIAEGHDMDDRITVRRIWRDGTIELGHWVDRSFVLLELDSDSV
jgi:hypothetical protein